MNAETVRALLFDTFGTVVDWRGSIARQMAAEFPDAAHDWAAFADAWRARYQPSMEAVRSGRRTIWRFPRRCSAPSSRRSAQPASPIRRA